VRERRTLGSVSAKAECRYDAPDAGITTASIESVAPGASARRWYSAADAPEHEDRASDNCDPHAHEGRSDSVLLPELAVLSG